MKALRGRRDSGLFQATLSTGDEKAALHFKCTVVKGHTQYYLETESKDLTFSSDTVRDKNIYSKKDPNVAAAKVSHSPSTDFLVLSSTGCEPESQTLLKNDLDKEMQKEFHF